MSDDEHADARDVLPKKWKTAENHALFDVYNAEELGFLWETTTNDNRELKQHFANFSFYLISFNYQLLFFNSLYFI